VVVRIDETGMDRAAARIENALRPKEAGDFLGWADGDDPAIGDRDRATLEDASLRV